MGEEKQSLWTRIKLALKRFFTRASAEPVPESKPAEKPNAASAPQLPTTTTKAPTSSGAGAPARPITKTSTPPRLTATTLPQPVPPTGVAGDASQMHTRLKPSIEKLRTRTTDLYTSRSALLVASRTFRAKATRNNTYRWVNDDSREWVERNFGKAELDKSKSMSRDSVAVGLIDLAISNSVETSTNMFSDGAADGTVAVMVLSPKLNLYVEWHGSIRGTQLQPGAYVLLWPLNISKHPIPKCYVLVKDGISEELLTRLQDIMRRAQIWDARLDRASVSGLVEPTEPMSSYKRANAAPTPAANTSSPQQLAPSPAPSAAPRSQIHLNDFLVRAEYGSHCREGHKLVRIKGEVGIVPFSGSKPYLRTFNAYWCPTCQRYYVVERDHENLKQGASSAAAW